jgi:hypothetical protein
MRTKRQIHPARQNPLSVFTGRPLDVESDLHILDQAKAEYAKLQ